MFATGALGVILGLLAGVLAAKASDPKAAWPLAGAVAAVAVSPAAVAIWA